MAGYITLNNAMDESVFIKDIALHSTDKSEKNRKASVPACRIEFRLILPYYPNQKNL
ncbi:MAG: hypothetical protein IPG60_12960 [Bacteroidetes bacterium]|nr:hypothetical protein [Bacteroidota bacterium]